MSGPRLIHSGSMAHQAPARLAKIRGRLSFDDDGCVFLASLANADSGVGLAWPDDYSARLDSRGDVEIIDSDGQVVLRQGQVFSAGGGYGPAKPAPWDTQHEREYHKRRVFCIQTSVRLENTPKSF